MKKTDIYISRKPVADNQKSPNIFNINPPRWTLLSTDRGTSSNSHSKIAFTNLGTKLSPVPDLIGRLV